METACEYLACSLQEYMMFRFKSIFKIWKIVVRNTTNKGFTVLVYENLYKQRSKTQNLNKSNCLLMNFISLINQVQDTVSF